ncbi:N-acetylglucosamine-6-phosphate deacetylase [Changpingibacter yushuensis]|uniref:N-acetylglucosamine-6-phosphate deacetylase n=1 Tax=Changpingibacter yushuensis TaxID=2758440 RepID=UPI0015F3E044|nr:amidohydrolase family protein [Changpingibacter yushuensis]
MTHYIGEVLDGFGRHIGGGLVLDNDGLITQILPAGIGTSDNLADDDGVIGTHIVPGLVDVHCHGGGGASFPDDLDADSIASAIAAHRSAGTTALVASLVSLTDPIPAIRALVPFCASGELAGIHMEGPYISPHKAGAQNPAAIRDADVAELESWLKAGEGWIRTMTIAPETGNAEEAARLLLRYGAKPSWGHTSTDGATTAKLLHETSEYAREIGLVGVPQTATHLFNAMPAINHREPGPIRELIQAARRGEVAVELIGDGVHIKPILVEDVAQYITDVEPRGEDMEGLDLVAHTRPDLAVLFVTDAIAAAGMPEGSYQLGGLAVDVSDGTARLAGQETIAGGCSRLSEQLTALANRGALSLASLVRGMVAGPALAASLTTAPRVASGVTLQFEVGTPPNFIVLDAQYQPLTVIREGRRI